MGLLDIILISLGLAMDATAVGLADGIAWKPTIKKALLIALSFGLLQGLFPLASYFLGGLIADWLAKIAPWIALALLCFIGGKMLLEGFSKKKAELPLLTFKLLLLQAISVSIDAFAVGVTFVGMSFNIFLAVGIIAAVTAILSFAAVLLGKKCGEVLGNGFSKKARIAGGIILIAIGIKIFVESLL